MPAKTLNARMADISDQAQQLKAQIFALSSLYQESKKQLFELKEAVYSTESKGEQTGSAMTQKQDAVEEHVSELKKAFYDTEARNKKNSSEIMQKQDTLFNEIIQNRGLLQSVRVEQRFRISFYQNRVEYNYYKNAFADGFRQITNFEERFRKLVGGLDSDSITTVVRIFQRMERIYQSAPGTHLDLFSIEEQEQLWRLRDRFRLNLIQVSDQLSFYQGYFLPCDCRRFEPCVFYYRHGLNLVRNIESTRNRDIIDAGAFIGDSALILSPLTDKTVYSFEPTVENYTLLEQTIQLNKLKNVKPVAMALHDKKATLTFNLRGSCSSGFPNDAFEYTGEAQVQGISLDEFVEENNLDVGLIKTDLEGAEQLFLRGAMRTIQRCKPILMISIYHTIDDFLDIKPMLEEMNLGYQFKINKPVDGSIMIESLLIAEALEE